MSDVTFIRMGSKRERSVVAICKYSWTKFYLVWFRGFQWNELTGRSGHVYKDCTYIQSRFGHMQNSTSKAWLASTTRTI